MNNSFQNKLLNYEATPAPEVWNKIAASLDDTSQMLSQKLYAFEQTPSQNVWEKINSNLDSSSDKETKVVPFFTRYRRPLKYSGALAIFILIAVVTTLLISKNTVSEVPQQTMNKQKLNELKSDSVTNKVSAITIQNRLLTYKEAPDNHLVFTTLDSQTFRLPKKMLNELICIENDVACKAKIQKLQQKIALTSFASDFFGVVDILKNVRENQ